MGQSRGHKRTKTEADRDRMVIAQMYLQGKTQRQIGQELGISQQQVSYDLKKVRKEWMERASIDFDRAKAQELAKLDAIEAEAWERHMASIGETETKEAEHGETDRNGKHKKSRVVRKQINGNPKWMDIILKCIDKRCQILGIADSSNIAVAKILVYKPADVSPTEWIQTFGGGQVIDVEPDT